MGLNALVNEDFNHGGRTHDAQVPVVFDGGFAVVGIVVRVAFDSDAEVFVFGQNFSELTQRSSAIGLNVPRAGCEHQAVVQAHIDLAIAHRNGEATIFKAQQGVGNALTEVGSGRILAGQKAFQLVDAYLASLEGFFHGDEAVLLAFERVFLAG